MPACVLPLVILEDPGMVLGLYLLGGCVLLLIFASSYIPCLVIARYVQRPGSRGWPAVLACTLLAGFPLLFLLFGWPGTDGEPLVAAAPLYVPLTFVAGVLLARGLVARNWWQAGLMALAGLVGHLVIGWPHAFVPVCPAFQSETWGAAHKHLVAAACAKPILKEYGLKVPPEYMVIETHLRPYGGSAVEAEIILLPRHNSQLFCPDAFYDLYYRRAAPIDRWLDSAGYLPVRQGTAEFRHQKGLHRVAVLVMGTDYDVYGCVYGSIMLRLSGAEALGLTRSH